MIMHWGFCVASLHLTFRQTLRFLSGAAAMEILGCFFVSSQGRGECETKIHDGRLG